MTDYQELQEKVNAKREEIKDAKQTITKTEAQLKTIKQKLQERIKDYEDKVSPVYDAMATIFSQFNTVVEQNIDKQVEELSNTADFPEVFQIDLNQVDWQQYDFNQEYIATEMVFGRGRSITAAAVNAKQDITYPLVTSFLTKTACYIANQQQELSPGDALQAMHEKVCRLSAMMPESAKFTLIDKTGLGANFIYQSSLRRTRQVSDDVARTLDEIAADIGRINRSFNMEVQSILDFDESIRRNEGFEFIMVANFPQGFDRRGVEALARIAENGPRCGKFVFLHLAKDAEFPNGTSLEQFKNQVALPVNVLQPEEEGPGFYPVRSNVMQAVFDGAKNAEKHETELNFDEGTPFVNNTEKWWQEDPARQVATPVGGSGAKKNDLAIWFGEGRESVCAHGMLGATTGAGKSNLYHTFIMGLACRYSPDDLQFYLVDGKQGVEFDAYRHLPHARVVSLFTSPKLARSVLQELVDTMERRNELFTRNGVSSFSEYRKAGEPEGKLARVIAVVDEYQTFFEDDRDGHGSELMLKLVSQSRSAGIHLFVGSQRFNVAGMQKQQAIFGNMHMRVGMKMTAADITALNEFQAGGKTLLRSCQEVGQAVINDALGDDSSNTSGRIFRMSDELRHKLLDRLQKHWQATHPQRELEAPVILNGSEQPNLVENPQLLHLLHTYQQRPSAADWEAFAKQPQHEGGLAVSDWYAVERPRVFWLGKAQSIYGQASILLRTRQAENLLMVGDNAEARLGMLTAITAQLAINHAHDDASLVIYDAAIEGSPWYGVVEQTAKALGLNYQVVSDEQQLAAVLSELTTQIDERTQANAEQKASQPLVYLVVNDVQRASPLQLTEGRFGNLEPNEMGKQLEYVLKRGPEVGLHSILSADSFRGASSVLDKPSLSQCRHRLALQMTDDESFKFINKRSAAKLQANGPKPINALYIEEMQNRELQFKPYAYSDNQQHQAMCQTLRDELARWISE